MAALSSSLDSGVNSVVAYHRGQSIDSKHPPMAALSSSLDSGVNSVVAYDKGQAVEVRVRRLR